MEYEARWIWVAYEALGGLRWIKMTESEIQCPSCSKRIRVQIYNAGLGDVVPFTCVRDSTVLTVSTQDTRLTEVLGEYPSEGWTSNDYDKVEKRLIDCPCGGKFKRHALPKCPNCGTMLPVEGLARSEFLVVGRLIQGEKRSPWRG